MKDLNQYLPYRLREIEDFREINNSLGKELDTIDSEFRDINNQFDLNKATWYLDNLDYILGLDTKDLEHEQRIEIIRARILGRGTTTKKMIKETAETFSGGEVEIEEVFDKYHFIIHFVGTIGRPSNMKGFKDMIDTIKPAHLTYDFKYRYITWEEVEKYKWGDLENYTWEEVLNGGVS